MKLASNSSLLRMPQATNSFLGIVSKTTTKSSNSTSIFKKRGIKSKSDKKQNYSWIDWDSYCNELEFE